MIGRLHCRTSANVVQLRLIVAERSIQIPVFPGLGTSRYHSGGVVTNILPNLFGSSALSTRCARKLLVLLSGFEASACRFLCPTRLAACISLVDV